MDSYEDQKLNQYYKTLFPFEEICRWLSDGVEERLFHREIGFVIKVDGKSDEIFKRNQSFKNFSELKEEVLKNKTVRFEIGPIFSHPPRTKGAVDINEYIPKEKELVFDVDMDAYDTIRTCCKLGKVCGKCWVFLSVAIQVIEARLREDFGFQHLLWVYSGRRGVHCWVSDPAARQLPSDARSAIADYLAIVLSGKDSGTTVQLSSQHPAFMETFDDILLPAFGKYILSQQQVMSSRFVEERKVLLSFLSMEDAKMLEEQWNAEDENKMDCDEEDDELHARRWEEVKKAIEKSLTGPPNKTKLDPAQQIVFAYTWPRLDINVTKVLNHLLKSPFCVHPATGKVCVPIDPKKCESFDTSTVPTLDDVLRDPATLEPYIKYFRDFIAKLKNTVLKEGNKNNGTDW